MLQEEIMIEITIWITTAFLAMVGILISFLFLHQRKIYRHKQEIELMQETFTKEMLHSQVEIQEQTLRHIASEIHDNFNPTLSVINLNLAGVMEHVQEPGKAAITDTKALVKILMAEMKALSMSLNTDHISRIGFIRSLEKFIDRLTKTGLYEISFTKTGEEYRLPANKEIILLRMCQEILNNIVKHAEARRINIHIRFSKETYSVSITDDGKGFDTTRIGNDPEKLESTGLHNLHKRAQAINASLSIESHPGNGTIITINIAQP